MSLWPEMIAGDNPTPFEETMYADDFPGDDDFPEELPDAASDGDKAAGDVPPADW